MTQFSKVKDYNKSTFSNGKVSMGPGIQENQLSPNAFFASRLKASQNQRSAQLSDGSSLSQRLGDGIISRQDYDAIKADYLVQVLNQEPSSVLTSQEEEVFHQSLSQAIDCDDSAALTQALHSLASHETEANAVQFSTSGGSFVGEPIILGTLQGLPQQGYVPGQDANYEFEQVVSFSPSIEFANRSTGTGMAVPTQVTPTNAPFLIAQTITPGKADQLQAPAGYSEARRNHLAPGITYAEFRLASAGADPGGHRAVRAVMVSPQQLDKVNVFYSDTFGDSSTTGIHMSNLTQMKNMLVVMNGTFMGGLPGGDIIGTRVPNGAQRSEQRTQPLTLIPNSAYANADKRTGENLEQRYSVAITHDNKIDVFRGGISETDRSHYHTSLGGGVLLFDRTRNPQLYNAVGTDRYQKIYEDSNEGKIVNRDDPNGPAQGGKYGYIKPRSALAVMPNGSLVFINLGEGKQRADMKGLGPEGLAVLLKQMGAIKAVMFDGGGAPVMNVKDQQGNLVERTTPDGGYASNFSFLTISQ